MRVHGIIWQEEIVAKLAWKHNIEVFEVDELFDNSPGIRFVEKGRRKGENVYVAKGQTDGGRYLVCFYIHKLDGRALIHSARDMTTTERRLYERK